MERDRALRLGGDLRHEAVDLAHLVGGAGAAIAHDDFRETEIEQPLDVVRDLREGAGAGLAGIERPRLCIADAEENLVGEREIRELPASLRRKPIKRLEALL